VSAATRTPRCFARRYSCGQRWVPAIRPYGTP
jgi:hypothetical protein